MNKNLIIVVFLATSVLYLFVQDYIDEPYIDNLVIAICSSLISILTALYLYENQRDTENSKRKEDLIAILKSEIDGFQSQFSEENLPFVLNLDGTEYRFLLMKVEPVALDMILKNTLLSQDLILRCTSLRRRISTYNEIVDKTMIALALRVYGHDNFKMLSDNTFQAIGAIRLEIQTILQLIDSND